MANNNKGVIDTYKPITDIIKIDLSVIDNPVDNITPVIDNINTAIADFIKHNPSLDLYTNLGLSQLLKGIKRVIRPLFINGDSIKPDYDNIQLIDNIWNVYAYICCYFGAMPTILRFGLMSDISNSAINTWLNGDYRSSEHRQTAQKWKAECESGLYSEVIKSGNIGCMFALKANYGYRDNVVINVTAQDTAAPAASVEQIAAELGVKQQDAGQKALPDAEF